MVTRCGDEIGERLGSAGRLPKDSCDGVGMRSFRKFGKFEGWSRGRRIRVTGRDGGRSGIKNLNLEELVTALVMSPYSRNIFRISEKLCQSP